MFNIKYLNLMGNKSTGPCTDKKIYTESCSGLQYICCEMQGWREYMEDASLCISNFRNKNNSFLFGIFDGHGGPYISKFASSNFRDIFADYLKKNQSIENAFVHTFLKIDELLMLDEVNLFIRSNSKEEFKESDYNVNNYIKFKTSYLSKAKTLLVSPDSLSTDIKSSSFNNDNSISADNNDILKDNKEESTNYTGGKDSYNKKIKSVDSADKPKIYKSIKKDSIAYQMGTTANLVFIEDKKIYVANVGDSYSVMYKNKEAIKMNTEHKTCIKSEEERIKNAGFKIINNRVDGKLNLSRAIGK